MIKRLYNQHLKLGHQFFSLIYTKQHLRAKAGQSSYSGGSYSKHPFPSLFRYRCPYTRRRESHYQTHDRYPNGTSPQMSHHSINSVGILAHNTSSQPIVSIIRHSHRILLLIKPCNTHYRSENFLSITPISLLQPGHNCRLNKVPLIKSSSATSNHNISVLFGTIQIVHNLIELKLINLRPLVNLSEWIPHGSRLSLCDTLFHELIIKLAVNKHSSTSIATLSVVEKHSIVSSCNRKVQI